MVTVVAGGAGFVGSHLCDRLISRGARVVCLDNLSTGRLRNIAHLIDHPAFTFVDIDITSPLPELPPLAHVYHLASPASPVAYQQQAIETLRANSEGTHRLLELACEHRASFLFASTSEVYGDPLEHPQRESYAGNVSPTGPRSMYDEAKRYGEALTTAFGQATGTDVRIARIFNTYGPRMDPADGRVISNFAVQSLRGEPITLYGDGTQTRSFMYIADLVDGLMSLMAANYSLPVNLGNPVEHRIIDLAADIANLAGSEAGFICGPLPQDDPKRRKPDISRAETLLGWSPKTDLRQGLMCTLSYFRELLAEPAPVPAVSPRFGQLGIVRQDDTARNSS
jgi:nucleoside-diphosphate-sugar epimerase